MSVIDEGGRPAFERDLLGQLVARWGKRVAVKQDELDLDGHFDPALADFPEHLLPARLRAELPTMDVEAKQRMLGAAWIAYNDKTGAIENEIILPACRLMLADDIPVRKDDVTTAALHQTIIDEHYHILMCQNAAGVSKRRRDLGHLTFDPRGWATVRGLHRYRADLSRHRRQLVDIAFALAAETTINLLFTDLAGTFDYQPMNRITVDMHRRDESGHTVVFRELARPLHQDLDAGDRDLFQDALLRGLIEFRAPDFDPWVTVAAEGGLTLEAAEIAASAPKIPPPRDVGPLRALFTDLGLTNVLGGALQRAAAN